MCKSLMRHSSTPAADKGMVLLHMYALLLFNW